MVIAICICCVLAFVMLFGVQFSEIGTFHEDSTSLNVSKGLQGMAAICIIIHHLSQKFDNFDLGPFNSFEYIGVLFVGIFFFFSGYGLIKSFKTKKNYLKGFFKKRLVTILIPTYICIFIYVIVSSIVWGPTGVWDYVFNLTGIHLANSHMWYIVEIIVLYIAFYLIFRFIKDEKTAFSVMGIFVIALITFSLLLGHCERCNIYFQGEWWYNSTFLFFIGMLIARFSDKIRDFLKSPFLYITITAVCIFLTCVFYNILLIAPGYWTEGYSQVHLWEKTETLMLQIPMIICFVFSVLLISLKVKFNNVMLRFLGSISLEVYLIHNVFLTFINGREMLIDDPGVYSLVVIVCSIIAAYLVHLLSQLLIKLILKPNKPKDNQNHYSSINQDIPVENQNVSQ